MMCRFLAADFELDLKCPVDRQTHHVRFQAHPLRGHALDVVTCNAAKNIDQLGCSKHCRALLESGEYWQRTYPESVQYVENR